MAYTESNPASYQHQPLHHEDEIRIVCIKPVSFSETDVCCEVIHHRRSSSALKYEALSYVWGDASDVKTIKIGADYSDLAVTSNCFDALRRLRLLDEERWVWIDAICINQKDDNEKIKQIQAMKEIYTQASRVIVDLGEADDTSKALFAYIDERWGYVNIDVRTADPAIIESAKTLIKRPWFSRVWVIQEVLSGQEAGVLVNCGGDTISWNLLAEACIELCGSYTQSFGNLNLSIPHILQVGTLKAKNRLLNVLCRTRPSNATDPRDKFFGILPLVEDTASVNNLATYEQTTTMVFTQIGLYLLEHYGLVMLQPIRHPHSTFPNLASWIPDWSRTDTNDPFYLYLSGAEDRDPDWQHPRPHLVTLECCRPNRTDSDHPYHPVLPTTGIRISKIVSLGGVFDFINSPRRCFDAVVQIIDTKGSCESNPYLPQRFVSRDCRLFIYLHTVIDLC